jgi:hypothetical protein
MTLGTNHTGMCAHQGKDTAVIECGWLPGGSGMAVLAGSTFTARMNILRQVAAHAGCGSALKITISVALRALDANMSAGQLEGKLVVVKISDFPGGCIVTGTTTCTESAAMGIILLMAAHAIDGQTLELEGRGVAVLAQQGAMLAIQNKNIEVVEGGWLPGITGMTIFAGCTFRTSMFIILLMTTDAGCGGITKIVGGVNVTILAFHILMLANQRETSHAVIKFGGILPTFLGVTCIASGTEL